MTIKETPKKLLARYQEKRDFSITAEPSGDEKAAKAKTKKAETLSFVIQKHDASHLHYDFRLELDGVLKSWAVAKGPSFMPSERRLAVEVEDHPLAYGGFEGIIPQGQYGGGTVMLWDRGTWEPLEDPHAGLKKGAIKFTLAGDKLKGHWTLVRMPPRPKDRNPNWLLIKEKDEYAKPEGPSLPKNDDQSVLSKRTMAQIEKASDLVWQSGKAEKHQPKTKELPLKKKALSERKGNGKTIGFVAPELATLADKAPVGDDWLHEIKFDGYRVIADIKKEDVTLYTRKGLDWTTRFPEIAEALSGLGATATIDGEVVVLRPDGISDFAQLQARLAGEKVYDLSFYVFDILGLEGKDLRNTPLIERKQALKKYLEPIKKTGKIHYTDHVEGSGGIFFEQGCRAGLEGIIAKSARAPYRSGRIGDWLKIKCGHRQEFVIGGYVPPTTGMNGIGSLSVGYYRDGKLIYGGRIGTGYTAAVSLDLRRKLDKLIQKACPFAGTLSSDARRGAVWVKPELVAEISYGMLTPDGIIRHGAFKGLREDKNAAEVTLEMTKPATIGVAKPVKTKTHLSADAEVAGVRISHPDKVLDPDSGLTKLRLAEYYNQIADWIMPHLEGRPLSIVRCPEGDTKPCFYQRHVSIGLPEDVYPIELDDKGGHEHYLTIKNHKGLISLVQVGALEIHPWGARNTLVESPDRMIFDLDPDPSVGWKEVVDTAFLVRDRLAKLKIKSFVKTTGGKGLHVVLPLDGTKEWPAVKAFAKNFAGAMVNEFPSRYIAVMSKKDRKDKIFIDYLRNDRTATAVVAYSTRARAGAPVATPLEWKELSPDIDPKSFTIDAVMQRLKGRKTDPWKGFFDLRQSITK